MKKYAIVDLGSNTIRISVYAADGGDIHLLFSEKETAGLVSYVEDGVMSEQGLRRACEALQNFQKLLRLFDMRELRVFATASLRNIRNTGEAAAYILAHTGLRVDVLSGETEARLGYLGALSSGTPRRGLLFDIGGGSTELVSFQDGEIQTAQSLDIGCLNLFRKNVTGIWPKKQEISAIQEQISGKLSAGALPDVSCPVLCGVGGTVRALLKLSRLRFHLPEEQRSLTIAQLEDLCGLLEARGRKARDMVLRACPDRVHTIIPGALLTRKLCRRFRCEELIISPYGVREGYLCQVLKEDMISATPRIGS